MVEQLARNWWLVALRGVLAILFGILAYIWPGITLATLVLLFGAYSLVDGVFAVGKAVANRRGGFNWGLLLSGIAGIIIGIIAFIMPEAVALALLYLIAAWAIITGIFQIVAAIQLRRDIPNEWLLILAGIASVIFGILCAIWPGASALAIIWLIAAYAIIFGVLLLILAFRLKGLADTGTATRAIP